MMLGRVLVSEMLLSAKNNERLKPWQHRHLQDHRSGRRALVARPKIPVQRVARMRDDHILGHCPSRTMAVLLAGTTVTGAMDRKNAVERIQGRAPRERITPALLSSPFAAQVQPGTRSTRRIAEHGGDCKSDLAGRASGDGTGGLPWSR
jgi:hypothetical protein